MAGYLKKRLQASMAKWIAKRLPRQKDVTLNQKRIFIVPTGQGLVLLLIACLILLLAINFESTLNFGLAFWLISMMWVAVHMTFRNLSGLTISAKAGNLVEVGEVAEVVIELSSDKNRSRGVLEIIDEQWGVIHVHMDGGAKILRIPLPSFNRGPIKPPRFRIESRFPFGLVVAWSNIKIDVKAWAYPVAKECSRTVVPSGYLQEQDSVNDHFVQQGSEDFHSLKPYASGDSIHRIHWPAFSRDQLLTKTFSDYQSSNEWLDWNDYPGLDAESKLAAFAFLAAKHFRYNQPYAVRFPDFEIEADKGQEHLQRVRRALAEYGYD